MRKKILAFTLVLFSAILLVACNKSTDQDVVDSALGRLTVQAEASENFTVSAKDGDVAITWVSQNTNILTVGATADDKTTITVARPAADTNVVLEATLKLGEVSEKKQFTVKVLAAEAVVDTVEVTFTVTLPEGTPAGDIFLAGNFDLFGDYPNWTPGGATAIKLNRDGLTATGTLTLSIRSTNLMYKVTRGDWANVEKDADGEEIDDRELEVTATTSAVSITVATWADDGSEAPVIIGLPLNNLFTHDVGQDEPDWLEGISATDDVDSTVEVTVDTTGLDVNVAGDYTIVFSATDSDDNTTTVNAT